MKEIWQISIEAFREALEKHPCVIHAFVLMSNHYHLLISTPEANIDQFMFEFNRNFSLLVREKTLRVNQIFGGRYKWSLVDKSSYLANVIRYIYRNPVDAGICNRVEEYSFSTLQRFPFPVVDLLENDDKEKIRFFNEVPESKEREYMRRGLRKKSFTPPINRKTREFERLPILR